MKRRPRFLPLLLLLFAAPACDSDGATECADGACERDERDQAGEPTTPPPGPIPCRRACEALTGTCGADERGDTTSIRAVAECIDWCESGGVTAGEAACLESVDCASADGCLI